MDLSQMVPPRLGEWSAVAADASYNRQTIFKYMNGAGEIYLSFDFRELFVRQFVDGEKTITVELYDMGSSEEAFGIFTRNRRGEDVGIGQGSEYRSGHLIFWKGRYFATVFCQQESDRSKDAVLSLAKAISARIEETGPRPLIVSLLPQQDLLDLSVRYFHKHTDLNEHYFISDDNILDLDQDTDATIATYRRGDARPYILIIRYPDAERATAAYGRFLDVFMPEARNTGVARLEDELWVAAARSGVDIEAVFDAPTQALADSLLSETRRNIEGAEE